MASLNCTIKELLSCNAVSIVTVRAVQYSFVDH